MKQIVLWIGLLLVCGLASCSQQPSNALKVGMELKYPPFEMADEEGRPKGVSVDLANALGEYLHRPVEIENIPFDGLIPSLKTGRIDLILSSLTATEERAKSIDFSDAYLTTGLAILAGNKSRIRSAADLDAPGTKVAVKANTTGQLYAAEHLKQAELLVLDQESTCVLEVVQGKADAFIYDQMSVLQNALRNPQTTRPLLQAFQTEKWAMGIRKGNDPLRTQVNDFLRDFRKSGGFDRLSDKWLKEQKEAFASRHIGFVM